MNEKKIHQDLNLLKEMIPSEARVSRLKKNIFREIDTEKETIVSMSWYRQVFARQYLVPVLLVLIMLVGSTYLWYSQEPPRPATVATQIAMAPNHYQKAKIAFEEAQRQLNAMKNSDSASIENIITITTTTQGFITKLHLAGEAGKYTAIQCETLHKDYAVYLSSLKARLEQTKQQAYEAKVIQFQKVISTRLAFYTS